MLRTRAQRHVSEHQKQTVFLRQCLLYDETAASHTLAERLVQLQRDERSVRRAAWLAALLTGLAVAGLGYSVALMQDFHESTSDFFSQFFVKGCLGLGIGSLICLLSLLGLALAYRRNLDRGRTESRRLVAKLLESRLGQPASTPGRDSRAGHENGGTVQVAAAFNSSPANTA